MTADTSREAVEAWIARLRDAYKRAKAENDERFQRERADGLAAKLDAVKAFCEKESGEIRTRYEPEGPYTGYANACDDVLAILADTDEGKSNA